MLILAISDIHGSTQYLEDVTGTAKKTGADVIVMTGDLCRGAGRMEEWRRLKDDGKQPPSLSDRILQSLEEDEIFAQLFYGQIGTLGIPMVTIPGNLDAPESAYFRNVLPPGCPSPNVKLVHHGFEIISEKFLFAGFGGEITDGCRETSLVLQYPHWEARFSFEPVRHVRKEKIFLFHSPPVGEHVDLSEGLHIGHRAVNDILALHKPYIAFCGHAHKAQGQEYVGNTLVVNPGSLKSGNYALVDTVRKEVKLVAFKKKSRKE